MVNDNYFRDIDDEAKAYYVGYLLADGSITKGSHSDEYNVVQLHLAFKDYGIIELLQQLTGNTRKIYVDAKQTRCMYRASSLTMVNDLARFGIVPKKTGCEKPDFSTIPTDLLRHTIRGMIDGDGWISISNTSTGRVAVSIGICGSYDMCETFTRYFNQALGLGLLTPSKVKDKNNYKLGYSSIADCKRIIEHLYSNSIVYLRRKAEKAKIILDI